VSPVGSPYTAYNPIVNDLIKTIDVLYNVYNCLLNFEFGCLNISLVELMNFLSFYKAESLIIVMATMFEAETIRSILDN